MVITHEHEKTLAQVLYASRLVTRYDNNKQYALLDEKTPLLETLVEHEYLEVIDSGLVNAVSTKAYALTPKGLSIALEYKW